MPSRTLNIVISADTRASAAHRQPLLQPPRPRQERGAYPFHRSFPYLYVAIMMVAAMPAFIAWVGMPEILGGAWIGGGTVDATGAVAYGRRRSSLAPRPLKSPRSSR